MLKSIKKLYNNQLKALDGDIGHVEDFYFDDQSWVVRYVVADTGSWLSERIVLLSPHAFGDFQPDHLLVNLTREQIEKSPTIDSHKPISRQHEVEYYKYYGWPSYWDGTGIWGMSGFPVAPPPILTPLEEEKTAISLGDEDDSHLRSTLGMDGYHLFTSEGTIGHVTDVLIDGKSWEIRHFVVETGAWFSGKEIILSPKNIDRISYEESSVFVNLTMKTIHETPEYHLSPQGETLLDTSSFK